MSEVSVNGETRSIDDGMTVDDIVRWLTVDAEGCAVAVNDAVVPRSGWSTKKVRHGDRVEVLTAVQGG
jgi:thiamine biosynthesis protein ThiS